MMTATSRRKTMESSYFVNSQLSDINFEHSKDVDLVRSSTVENLISQNEDLMSRFKIALRRMHNLESENQKLQKQIQDIQYDLTSQEDLKLLHDEKQNTLRFKIQELENSLEGIKTELASKTNQLEVFENEIVRYRNIMKEFAHKSNRISLN
jgi:chromosome segregation ATPase